MDIDVVFSALADRSRRRIIATLAADPQDNARACGSFDLPVSKATRTHHFRVLRDARLIEQRHHGNGSSVALRRADIQTHLPGLLDILLTELRETPPSHAADNGQNEGTGKE